MVVGDFLKIIYSYQYGYNGASSCVKSTATTKDVTCILQLTLLRFPPTLSSKQHVIPTYLSLILNHHHIF